MLFLKGPKSIVVAMAFSPEGGELAVGARDGSLNLVDPLEGTFRLLGEISDSGVQTILFDETGQTLLYGGSSGWFGFQRTEGDNWNVYLPRPSSATTALAFLNEKTLVVGSGDRLKAISGHLELRNTATGKRLEPHFPEQSGVRAVAVHSASHTVAWANASNRVSIWNTHTIQPRHIGLTHNSPSLAFQPDGERLAVAMEWGVKVYEVATQLEKLFLKGHTGRVTAVAYSPDGKTIVTSSWDQTVRVWDAASGAIRSVFDWGIGKVFSLAFSPDGLLLAAGGENGGIALWDIE